MGLPCPEAGHPRVDLPMIDDGTYAGVPIGGLGTGSIGRTHRGDFARWHLEVGKHAFAPVAADGFSIFVGRPGGGGTATVLSTLRPDALPAWGWTLPEGAGTYHALFPRAWQAFEPEVLGVRLVGEQLSPVIAGDLESSALPVGVFEWWVENPGPDPLTVGIMLTWQDPVADHGVPAPAGAWHETIETHDVGGAILHAPVDAPSGLRGTFAVATSRAPGVTVTIRDRFDAVADEEVWADFAADGRLDAVTDPRPSAAGEAIGVAVAATVDLAPGERRSVRFALGVGSAGRRVRGRSPLVQALHARLGPDRRTRLRPGQPRPRERDRRGARRSRRGSGRSWLRTTAPTGTRRRSSTSSTSSSMAGRSGRPARSTARNPTATTPAGSRCSSASTTRSTTASTSTSTPRSRSCGSSPSSRRAGSATCWPRWPSTTRRSSRSRRPGLQRSAQGRRDRAARRGRPGRRPVLPPEPLSTTRTSTTGRTSVRSSSSRSGATRSPPGPTATP